MSGGIPPELGRLAALESLDLSDNRLTDPLPPQLGRLSSLNALNLENNLFQGAIPPELGALPLFTHLLYGSRSFSAENLGLRIGGNLWTGCLPPAWSELGLYALIGLDLDFCIEGREFQPPLLSSSRQVNVGEEEEPGEAHSCWAAAALAPALKMAGDYDNLAKDLEGHYELALTGARVAATFTTKRSPIPLWSKRPTTPLFILPEGFRPPFPILRTSVGKPVEAEGDQPLPGLIYLQVNPDGTVHHLARPRVEDVGSWSYRLQTGWGTTPPAADRWALETVYAALKGNAWLRQQPWSCPGQPLEDWPGVATNAAGRVVQLDLRNHGLQGALPSELGDLTALRTLDLSNNNLEGPLPVSLGQLTQLEILDLSDDSYIDISPAQTTDYYGLQGPIPSTLGQLAALQRLNLANNDLDGVIPPELGQLTALETLYLGSNQLRGNIPPALGKLARLEQLSLAANRLSGAIPPELGQLTSLRILSLGLNRLSGAIPPELGQLDVLVDLALSDNQLRGAIPLELGQLTSLEELWLINNQLSGTIPPELAQLRRLERLHLDLNQLQGPIPAELGQITSLMYLSLSSNRLTDEVPPELGRLTNLKGLNLEDNLFGGAIPPELGALPLDMYYGLRLMGNSWSGCLPPAWSNLGMPTSGSKPWWEELRLEFCLEDGGFRPPPEMG